MESLSARPIPNVNIVAPTSLSATQLTAVHDSTFVRAVETGQPRPLAASAGLGWDAGLWTSVCASNGGIVQAARVALDTGANTGSLSSGLHHSRRHHGAGFCTFNGLALAARAALDAGAKHVVILDVDAHPGDGTVAITTGWPHLTHVDLITGACGAYEPGERQWQYPVLRGDAYMQRLQQALRAVDLPADLIIYNAGMDPHEDCDIGGLDGVTADVLFEREDFVFQWAALSHIPVAFALAGGYSGSRLSRQQLVNLHRFTIEQAAEYSGA